MTVIIERLSTALAGRYTIERELGRGGMATVYLARDLKHDRPVALKVLDLELGAAVGYERFRREIALAAKMDHPNILAVLDSGEADGLLFYVMPHVEGGSLGDRLAREAQLPLDDALRITRDVASALSHAHSLGIVHRDIKPGNILLSGERTIVADFGIAKAVTESGGETLTETGLAVGTPAYMSPEQTTGRKDIDGRTDVYSLGCVFYHMIVGEPPFTGPSAQAVMARHAIDPVSPLSTVRSTVPIGIDQAVAKALAKVPADRYTTAVQFAEALEQAATAAVDAPASRKPRSGAAWAIGTLAVVVAVVGGWWATARSAGAAIERIAVLPPIELGADPDQAPIVQGMYNGLLTELGQAGVRVIGSLQSMLRYQGTAMTVPQIAIELGVDAVIEPSVFWVGDSVGISVRLIDGHTEESLWSQSYDADARNLIALYREVTRAIAGEIQVALTPAGEARLTAAKPVDPAAQEAYLRGQFFANQLFPGSLDSGLAYFERALAIDSTYAPAGSLLGVGGKAADVAVPPLGGHAEGHRGGRTGTAVRQPLGAGPRGEGICRGLGCPELGTHRTGVPTGTGTRSFERCAAGGLFARASGAGAVRGSGSLCRLRRGARSVQRAAQGLSGGNLQRDRTVGASEGGIRELGTGRARQRVLSARTNGHEPRDGPVRRRHRHGVRATHCPRHGGLGGQPPTRIRHARVQSSHARPRRLVCRSVRGGARTERSSR